MILKQNEIDVITELQTQEKNCVEKYRRYKEQAKDEELKNLFGEIEQLEQKHYDTLGQVLNGDVPCCDCKQADNFLVTDCIGTEKMVSSEYNTNVFRFGEPSVRKLLADIQVEEQNHAEMLYKYKTVNGMS